MDGVERAAAARAAATKFSAAPSVGFDLLETDGRPDDLSGLLRHAGAAIESPERYFEPDTPVEFTQDGESITFKSPLASGAANDVARARLSEVRHRERAVVLLHHWNAEVEAYRPFARLLAASGIACLQLSLPYHHERRTPGVGFARELVCENLGLTIRSNRQAILEVRACLAWLERQGFRRLGIIGVSVGSSIGSIVAALDSRVSAAVLILMADDFAEVVWTGSATAHVKSSLERRFFIPGGAGRVGAYQPGHLRRTAQPTAQSRIDHIGPARRGVYSGIDPPLRGQAIDARAELSVDSFRLRTLYAAAVPIFGADRHEYHHLSAATALTPRTRFFILGLQRYTLRS
ncbi:alpha/beta hydrolase family protein [Bradyrhizobium yuanmingense]|uniref:alpha/beta hydrolase family protein n=1 Tax=Bradyrhizobium yuanmingense TaxID=108015 RepID=UPI0035134B98